MGSNVSVDTDGGMPGGQTTLSFTAPDWNTAQTVTVSAAADENISPETVTLSHTAAGGDYASVSQDLAVTVTDDDTPGLVFSTEAVTVVEAASATYTVQLAYQPSAAVTVTVRGMDSGVSVDTDSGMEGKQTSLSFSTSDWNTGQTVTVNAAADENLSSERVTLSHSAMGGGYDSVSQELMVTVTDANNICVRLSELNADGTTCNLSNESISSLSSDDFDGLPNLRELHLSNNDLSSLPADVFAGLPNLRELHLNNNNLSSLPADVFAGLSNLEELRIYNNNLSSLPANLFAGLSNLKSIWIYGNNLSSLPADMFAGLSNLEQILLSGNQLSSLPADIFSGLPELKWLSLSDNGLTCLPVIPPDVIIVDRHSFLRSLQGLPHCYALELSPSAVITVEGDTSTYTVKLSNQPSAAVTVTVTGMGSGVSVDTDHDMAGDQTSFSFSTSNWQTEQTVTVTAAEDDNTVSEAVTLIHTAPSGGSTYSVSKSLAVTVIDNDTPALALVPATVKLAEAGSATYTVRLAKAPTADVTVTVSSMGSGVSVDTDAGMPAEQTSLSFSTSNWQTEQTVTVSAAADDNAVSEEVTLTHSATGGGYNSVTAALVATVTDDDTAGLVLSATTVTVAEAGSATYAVRLASQPSEAVTVTMSGMGSGVSVDTDAGMPGGQTSLSFSTSNWQMEQPVTVSAAADDNAVSEEVTLTHSATGGGYNSVTAELVATVTEDDTAGLVFSPTTVVTVAEGNSGTYTVRLASQPSAAVTVTVSEMGSGVSVDTDAGMPGEQTSLSFSTSNWQAEQTVTVSAAADDNAVSEEVTLTHSATGGDYNSVTAELVATVTEDETVGLVFSPEAVTVVEAASDTYTVRLASQPSAAVTVTVSGMGSGVSVDTDSGMDGDQSSLSFSTSDWNTGQPVTVRAAADENLSSEKVTLSHSVTGGGYDSVSQKLVVTVTDDNNICVRLSGLSPDGTRCDLSQKGIRTLSSDDFDGLPNLRELYLGNNNLSSLPGGCVHWPL